MSTVMIAEDDRMMADMLEEILETDGHKVCGVARTVDEAIELGNHCQPDLAILDIRLAGGGTGTDIPARLKRHGHLGVLYASGNVGELDLKKVDGDALLKKPYRREDVLQALKIVEHIVSIGGVSHPFPKGFSILNPSFEKDKAAHSDDDKSSENRRLRRQQKALADFGSFALSERDLSKGLTEAARVCAECFEVPFCKVCRFRSEENDLLVEAGVGWHEGVIGRVVSRADASSPQGRAISTEKPVICGDLTTDVTFLLPAVYGERHIVSIVDVVVKKESRPYGVLEIDSPVQRDYDEDDINFLTGFANILAESVNTSKRNSEMQSSIDRMRDMVKDKDKLLVLQSELLQEKAVLARELQHRVRNNLQLVYEMLDRQIQAAPEKSAMEGISAIARCVMTLAQVYEHLLGTGLSRTIDFSKYLLSLCSSLGEMEGNLHPNVHLDCDLHPVILDLESVTDLGLITSEVVANSYAHAFPTGSGSISVSLSQNQSHDLATMIIADDGIGFTNTDGNKRHGLGLVKRLMEQLGGSATLRSDHGTQWTLDFPVSRTPPASKSVH